MGADMPQNEPKDAATPGWRRYVPLAIILILVGLVLQTGLAGFVSFDEIARRYAELDQWVTANPLLAFVATLVIYTASTAVSFPLAWLLTVAAGLLLGWAEASAAVVLGATIGACILFWATKLALADFFRARAGNALAKMADGFRGDAVSYLLFLRLAPVFPFTLVNVVPAILGVKFVTYAWTTLVGIIPGTVAYAFAGEGLRSIIGDRAAACAANIAPCGEPIAARDLVTTQIIIAFALLSLVALLPVLIKRFRKTR